VTTQNIPTANQLAELYPVDYPEHERTRLENDQILLPVINEIKSGKHIEQLDRFAKAYLGMFLDLDNSIPPNDRINILANPQLAEDIKTGFAAILKKDAFPSPGQIADSIYTEEYPEGYVLLAALDLYSNEPEYDFSNLPSQTVIAAICFHYAYQTEIHDKWFVTAMQERQQDVISAFSSFWQRLIKHNTDHLPGLYQFIEERKYDHLSGQILLPVLANWHNVRKKVLSKLLHTAIRTTDHKQLLEVCRSYLENGNAGEPGRYILWLTTAFFLAPDDHETELLDYTGRSKEKIIPLVDFVSLILSDKQIDTLPVDNRALATLLRIIAPKITPQEDRYGQICDNTRKVMYLFYLLAIAKDTREYKTLDVIEQLGQVRVMKLYNPILDYIIRLHESQEVPNFDDFITKLIELELIKARIKRYD
jgi:hypothetical protein